MNNRISSLICGPLQVQDLSESLGKARLAECNVDRTHCWETVKGCALASLVTSKFEAFCTDRISSQTPTGSVTYSPRKYLHSTSVRMFAKSTFRRSKIESRLYTVMQKAVNGSQAPAWICALSCDVGSVRGSIPSSVPCEQDFCSNL